MREKYTSLHVYWKPRRESAEQCADRISWMFSELAGCNVRFAIWNYPKMSGRFLEFLAKRDVGAERLSRFSDAVEERTRRSIVDFADRGYLLRLLHRGRHRRDSDRSVIEELGFIVSFLSSQDPNISIRVECGCYAERSGNCVTLELPERELLGDFGECDVMARLLSTIAKVWAADHGHVELQALLPDTASDTGKTWHYYRWMTYFSRAFKSQFPALPDQARIVPVNSIGTIIVAQDEPPDLNNPQHVRNVEQVEAALKADEETVEKATQTDRTRSRPGACPRESKDHRKQHAGVCYPSTDPQHGTQDRGRR